MYHNSKFLETTGIDLGERRRRDHWTAALMWCVCEKQPEEEERTAFTRNAFINRSPQ
jgi:hypothetical protein